MTDKMIVLSTCGSVDEAEKIARGLVEARLAACVNIVPGVRSVYLWKGAVETAPEWLLVIKTRGVLLDPLRRELERLHSYEVPEVVAIPIEAGAEKYLAWIDEETRAQA